ncbi:MAG: hypothetical protein ACOYU0_01410 [Nitrospirota bacterium]
MRVIGSELTVLKMIEELGKLACTPTIARKLRFYPDYVDILINSLIKSGYVTKAGRTTYKLTSKGREILGGLPEVPEVKRRPKRLKRKKR